MVYKQFAIDAIDKTIAAANSSGLLDHNPLIGRLREIVIEDLLRPFLSPRFKTATGKIVDPIGNLSDQIDIIIYDEEVTPPISFSEREAIVPCHAAIATVEVKSKLTSKKLDESIKNARSVKLLQTNFRSMSTEAGIRRQIDEEVIEIMKDGPRKSDLADALRRVSSTACYLFAFESDLTNEPESRKEYKRLQRRVYKANKNNPDISVPISGLCIADRVFHYCVHAEEPIKFKDTLADRERPEETDKRFWASHNVILKFISKLVDVANIYASQRWRIPLEVYFGTIEETANN